MIVIGYNILIICYLVSVRSGGSVFKPNKLLLILTLILVSVSCGTFKSEKVVVPNEEASFSLFDFNFPDMEIFKKDKKEEKNSKLVENNKLVGQWIKYFAIDQKRMFERYLGRGAVYKQIIERELTKEGLPKDLYYLAMIESGFVYNAISSAGAVGIWQLMPATARRYGLTVNRRIDERLDPLKATKAAAKYLKDLHNVYHSWNLAIASYNSGERRVMKAIMKSKSRDYWKITQMKNLPKETSNYVPKFMAAVEVGGNLDKYKIDQERVMAEQKSTDPKINVRHVKDLYRYKKVRKIYVVKRGDSLWDISNVYKVPVKKLKRMNRLRSNKIYVGQKLNLSKRRNKVRGKTIRKKPLDYMVVRGDSLIKIARDLRVSVDALRVVNKIKNDSLYVGQILTIPK